MKYQSGILPSRWRLSDDTAFENHEPRDNNSGDTSLSAQEILSKREITTAQSSNLSSGKGPRRDSAGSLAAPSDTAPQKKQRPLAALRTRMHISPYPISLET